MKRLFQSAAARAKSTSVSNWDETTALQRGSVIVRTCFRPLRQGYLRLANRLIRYETQEMGNAIEASRFLIVGANDMPW